jgi:UDP-N-acetylmuramate--alanine ligase
MAAGMELGVSFEDGHTALAGFTGARRRLQILGEDQGVLVLDDYAHHPTEVKATLQAARNLVGGKEGKLRVAFQPHLFSRTQALYKDFALQLNAADEIFLCDIYPAREVPIPGVTSMLIVDSLKELGAGDKTHYASKRDELLPLVLKNLKPGDVFLTLGAGTIDTLGKQVAQSLKEKS